MARILGVNYLLSIVILFRYVKFVQNFSNSKWKTPFTTDRAHILQVRSEYDKSDYMYRLKLKAVQCVKDFCVKLVTDLRYSQQCTDTANREKSGGLHYQRK